MLNTVFAILLGLLALYAVYAAFRAGSRRRTTGWILLAAAAGAQVVNLVSGYSLLLAIVTTAGILAGLLMIRAPEDASPRT